MKKFYGYVDGSFEIELSEECIRQCYHQGHCDDDCERWIEIPEIWNQFKKIKKDVLISHIQSTGADYDTDVLRKWTKKVLAAWVLWEICGTIQDSEDYEDEN